MKIYARILVPWVALSLALLACAGGNSLTTAIANKLETGSISFASPVDGTKLHQDATGLPPHIPVSINSTFDTDKNVRLYINGLGPVACLARANQTTICPNELPYKENDNILVAETFKVDEITVVSAQTNFTWTPYTSVDKFVATVTGNKGGDPTMGYILLGFFAAVIAAVTLAIKAREAGAILGFFLVLIALAAFTSLSASAVSVVVIKGVIALAGGGLILFGVFTWIKSGHSAVGPQGSKTWVTFPNGVKAGKESWHSGYVGPGEHSPKLNDPGVDLLEAGRKAGFTGLPDPESYDTPLRLEK